MYLNQWSYSCDEARLFLVAPVTIIETTSAMTCGILMNVKMVALILASVCIFGSSLGPLNWLGILVAVAGAAWYAREQGRAAKPEGGPAAGSVGRAGSGKSAGMQPPGQLSGRVAPVPSSVQPVLLGVLCVRVSVLEHELLSSRAIDVYCCVLVVALLLILAFSAPSRCQQRLMAATRDNGGTNQR
ncbi:unnamed protein product [Prorocentrum cordatum]|uniref:Sugar phosphate transporter domain-containing protein n=1 Tax=Prorocentrum cordatum TaxID=2364126 RepID=A0ABN9X166_9DINO|nr:unnamed protein product [Polarella glacialis]